MSLLAAGPALLLGMLGNWLGGFISPDAAEYGQWVGWAIACTIYIQLLISFVRYERQQRQLARADKNNQLVQDIHVTNPRIVEIAMVGNTGPNLATRRFSICKVNGCMTVTSMVQNHLKTMKVMNCLMGFRHRTLFPVLTLLFHAFRTAVKYFGSLWMGITFSLRKQSTH